jgi:hypothetical protein
MKKFWKWMVEKGYGHIENDLAKTCKLITHNEKYLDRIIVEFSKQMLVGYMVQYLLEVHRWIAVMNNGYESIEHYYDILKQKIEELGQEKS